MSKPRRHAPTPPPPARRRPHRGADAVRRVRRRGGRARAGPRPAGNRRRGSDRRGRPAGGGAAAAAAPAALSGGQLLVGAAKSSIAPRPGAGRRLGDRPGDVQDDRARLVRRPAEGRADRAGRHRQPRLDLAGEPELHLHGRLRPRPGQPGQQLRRDARALGAVAGRVSDGAQTLVLTVVDGEGWLWDYNSKCTDCGAKQIAATLAADPELAARGVTGASHVLHATHSHASPDFIGGWGFVPNWYMTQVADTIRSTAKQAVLGHGAGRAGGRRGRGAGVQQRAPRHLPLGRGAAAELAARRHRRARSRAPSPRSAPTPPTRRPRAPTTASRTRTGPACSRSASRSASAASACTSCPAWATCPPAAGP